MTPVPTHALPAVSRTGPSGEVLHHHTLAGACPSRPQPTLPSIPAEPGLNEALPQGGLPDRTTAPCLLLSPTLIPQPPLPGARGPQAREHVGSWEVQGLPHLGVDSAPGPVSAGSSMSGPQLRHTP